METQNGVALTTLMMIFISTGIQIAGLSLPQHHQSAGTVRPYLEPIKFNTTVFVGQSAYLPCVVKHLGDKTVSWIRQKDLHILSSGSQVYTNDKRFSLLREGKLRNAWTLKISPVAKKDEGTYECQINTEPKMTAKLYLSVLGSAQVDSGGGVLALGMLDSPIQHQKDDHRRFDGYEAKILGPDVLELEQGQIANFTCIITHGGTAPNVTWFLNEIPIQNIRGGFSVDTEKSSFSTKSTLVIIGVAKGDEGKYSCGGVTVYPDSVILKIRSPNQHQLYSAADPRRASGSSSATLSASPALPFVLLPALLIPSLHNYMIITWLYLWKLQGGLSS